MNHLHAVGAHPGADRYFLNKKGLQRLLAFTFQLQP